MPCCRHSNKLSAATFAIFVVINAGSAKPKIGYQPDPLHPMADPAALFAAFVVLVGLVQPSLPALILLLTTTSQSGPAGAAAAFLSRPIFQKLAGISYDLYLLHPLVCMRILPHPLTPNLNTLHPPEPPGLAAESCGAPMRRRFLLSGLFCRPRRGSALRSRCPLLRWHAWSLHCLSLLPGCTTASGQRFSAGLGALQLTCRSGPTSPEGIHALCSKSVVLTRKSAAANPRLCPGR